MWFVCAYNSERIIESVYICPSCYKTTSSTVFRIAVCICQSNCKNTRYMFSFLMHTFTCCAREFCWDFVVNLYERTENCLCCQMNVLVSTKRMQELERKFDTDLVQRADRLRASKPPVELPPRSDFINQTRSSLSAGQSLSCSCCVTFQCLVREKLWEDFELLHYPDYMYLRLWPLKWCAYCSC